MGSTGHYLTRHGAGYRFQMGIPADLQSLLGRKLWRQYLATTNAQEARLTALQMAVTCQREIDRLRRLPKPDPTQVKVPHHPCDPSNLESGDVTAAQNKFLKLGPHLHPLPEKVEVLTSIPSLVRVWQQVAEPRARATVNRMKYCANEFVSLIGNLSANRVTRAHVMQYRDMLERKTYARSTAKQYLDGIHRLFAIAHSEGLVESNPVTGIKLRTARDKFIELQRRRPFEVNEIGLLFDALTNETEPFQWLVRLLVYHGMRSGEAAQLRVEDVTTISNVPVIRVHDRYGSLKNRHSHRDIPLHPKCCDFISFAQTVANPWIFPQGTLRSDRFQSHAGYFLRRKVGLTDRALTMHSLRHTWRTLAREICMPPAVSRAIMGHSMGGDVHDEYGGRPSLRLMAEWMSRMKFEIP